MGDELKVAERAMPEAAKACGDLLDDFPCIQCGAKGPSACPLPPSTWMPARDLLNSTIGLGNLLRARVAKARKAKSHDQ